jgi:tetraacyldisaccharide 4'-kinase
VRARLQQWVHQRWYTPETDHSNQSPGRLETFINQRLLKRRRVSAVVDKRQRPPVIVIGNLVAGGGGKSPIVLHLAKQLQAQGKTVAIIVSGYGGSATHAREVTAQDDAKMHSDEAVMLAQSGTARVFAASKRVQAYRLAVAKVQPHIVISDDGLQHFELPRALQLVCIDQRLFGNGRPLPFGPMREPVEALAQMDGIIVACELNHAGWQDMQKSLSVPVFRTVTKATQLRRFSQGADDAHDQFDLTDAKQVEQASAALQVSHQHATAIPVELVAGIANPAGFASLVKQTFTGIATNLIALADHQWPSDQLLQQLVNRPVLMTEKDAVKWQPAARALHLEPTHWWVLSIERHTEPDLGQFVLEQLA